MSQRHAPAISCESLFEALGRDDWVVFDCRHDLTDPAAGPAAFQEGHIEGAVHAHMDHDLADPVGDGSRGRHPLPDPARLLAFLRAAGLDDGDQVVVYDHGPGMWAARLWWVLRDLGHEHVAVLDGGLDRWRALGLPVVTPPKRASPRKGTFTGTPGHMPRLDAAAIETRLEDATLRLIDARAPERYRGDEEPLDPVAGHIPGAANLPFSGNIGPDGMFLSPDELRSRFEGPGEPVMYCGSGVTAAHNVLAMEIAGMPTPALYPGSWSEWCQPGAGRPTSRG